jgi:hypothetical protein
MVEMSRGFSTPHLVSEHYILTISGTLHIPALALFKEMQPDLALFSLECSKYANIFNYNI